MSVTNPDTERRDKLEQWRFEQLKSLGFTEPAALELAAGSCDVHAVARALEHGCGHPLAYKIFR